MRILTVLRACVRIPAGDLLPDDCIGQMVQTCYRISKELRRSQLLRRLAEQVLADLVRTCFGRLADFSDSDSGKILVTTKSADSGGDDDSFVVVEHEAYGIEAANSLLLFLCSLVGSQEGNMETVCLGFDLVETD